MRLCAADVDEGCEDYREFYFRSMNDVGNEARE
jgi:hypothetical protein